MREFICLLLLTILVGVLVGCGENAEPVIEQLIIPETAEPGNRVIFQVVAHDPDGDVLIYTWIVNNTRLTETTSTVEWTVPEGVEVVTIEVHVSDGENTPVIQQQSLAIGKLPIDLAEIEPPEFVPPVDLSKHSVPLDEIFFDTFQPVNRAVPLSKASAELIEELRDAIPPLNNPKYESAAEATWLDDRDVIIGYADAGQAWAYPIRIMNFHEIVNDTLAGEPILISFCPLCFSGIGFSRRLENRTLTFGNTSALFESDMVMLDYETGSYWWQVAGRAIVGTLTDKILTLLPSFTGTWGEWRNLHPETQVLSRDTGFPRDYSFDPFRDYPESVNRGKFAFPVSEAVKDPRLAAGEKVLAVKVGNDAKAYPVAKLGLAAIMDTIGGQSIVVFTNEESGAAFKPIAVGRTLTFEVRNKLFTDQETSSIWNLAGQAIDGPLKGAQLPPVPTKTTFWFSIVAAEPGITVCAIK